MTIEEQSVKAIMPMRSWVVSGASEAKTLPAQPVGRLVSRAAIPDTFRNCRRESDGEGRTAEFLLERKTLLLIIESLGLASPRVRVGGANDVPGLRCRSICL